jgi:hypothetical protein
MPRRTLLIILSIFGVLALFCIGAVIFFETYGQSPEVQARVQDTQTAEAAQDVVSTAQAVAEPTRLAASQLLLEETFELGTPVLEVDSASIQNGSYQTEIRYAGAFHVLSSGKTLTDFVAEVDCTVFSSLGQCGVAFAAQYGQDGKLAGFYAVYLTGDGYGFRSDPLEGSQSGSSKTSALVKPGTANILRVVRINNEARVYVNDQELDRIELDAPSLQTGEIGLFIGLASEAGATDFAAVTADNFQVWEVPE